jgi:hypothetical protein
MPIIFGSARRQKVRAAEGFWKSSIGWLVVLWLRRFELRPEARRVSQHANRGLVEQGAYATRQLRQRRSYHFYPWNRDAAKLEPQMARSAEPRDRLRLASHYQALMDSGEFESRAALAQYLDVRRARVTRVLNRLINAH